MDRKPGRQAASTEITGVRGGTKQVGRDTERGIYRWRDRATDREQAGDTQSQRRKERQRDRETERQERTASETETTGEKKFSNRSEEKGGEEDVTDIVCKPIVKLSPRGSRWKTGTGGEEGEEGRGRL